jgi:hypothetical protein
LPSTLRPAEQRASQNGHGAPPDTTTADVERRM